MKRLVLLNISFLLVFCACNPEGDSKNKVILAKGDKVYGGVFKLSIPSKPSSLFPYSSISYYEQQLSSQIYETLFTTDSTQKSEGNIAEKHELLDGGRTFRIHLKKNIFFHNEGGNLQSKDVFFSLAFLCSSLKENNYSYLFIDKIKGAKSFYEKSKTTPFDPNSFEGAKIINDFVIDVYLTFPFSQFSQLLSHPNAVILSYEDYKKNNANFFKNPLGTGPFILEKITETKTVITRNDNYWKHDEHGNKLPFLDAVEAYYGVNERDWFQSGKLDMIQNISTEKLNSLFGNLDDAISGKNQPHRLFQLKNKNLNFLVYNTVFPPFDNKTNRQRIHSSINTLALCENILDGDGEPTKNFFVPINYYKSLNSAEQEISAVEETRGNTLKAGDKINFFINKNTSELGLKWVNELILQIKANAGISINLIKGSNEDFERMWKKGEIHIAKYGWAADYPDPDSYLGVFYSRSTLAKQISFSSAQYDSIYLNSFRKSNRLDRLKAQLACDRFLIQNAFVSPLFLQDFIFVVNINMRDFKVNMEGLLDFSCVFYKPVQKLN